jgi:putative oxidoreductase
MKKRYAITEVISAIFIFLFVYTALSKIFTFNLFAQTLKETPLIGGIAIYIAILLPAVELILSLLLLIPRTRRFGLYSTFALMLVFTLYLGYMILFTPHRPCTCGGVLEKMTWTQHLIFNIFFTILSLIAILMKPHK